jgi:hypothetical protein
MNEIVGGGDEFETPKSESEISKLGRADSNLIGSVAAAAGQFSERVGKRRWIICALLFFAATINYIDRQVFGIVTTDETFRALMLSGCL